MSGSRPSLDVRSIVAVAALGSTLIYQLLPDPAVLNSVYFAFGLACALVVIAVGFRQHHDAGRALICIGVGIACGVAGDFIWAYDEAFRHQQTAFPSGADALYLSSYPLQLLGLWLLLRSRVGAASRETLLDVTVVTCGMASLAWTFVIRFYALDPGSSPLERTISALYPIADVLLVAVIVRLFLLTGTSRRTERWMAAATLTCLGADVIYSFQTLHETYHPGSIVDTIWLASYACWMIGALYAGDATTAATPARPTRASSALSAWRVGYLALGALLAPVCLVFWIDQRTAPDLVVVATLSALTFVLVMARLVLALQDLARANRLVVQSQTDRRTLLQEIVATAERERVRIAAELHDGPVQTLSAVSFDLQLGLMALAEGDRAEVETIISRTTRTVTAEVRAIRQLMTSLRPPILDEAGIAFAIEEHARTVAERTGLAITCTLDPPTPLSPTTETDLYRIVQEALSNVTRHAGAHQVAITLTADGGWARLAVQDDGSGVPPLPISQLLRTGHYGLAGIAERAEAAGGSMTIEPAPTGGTLLTIMLPVQPALVPAVPRPAAPVGPWPA